MIFEFFSILNHKKLKTSQIYIIITGTQYYQNFAPFSEETIVDLIRESDNPHDRYAIRVEIKGETVGYVANNQYTLIKEVKSARDLKHSQSHVLKCSSSCLTNGSLQN